MTEDLRTNGSLRERLKAASAKLREVGAVELAESVDEVLAPHAWGRLRQSDPAASKGRPNLSIRTTPQEREHLKKSAKAVGDSITHRVNEGLRLFLSGEFVPDQPTRAVRGTAPEPAFLTVRPDEQLRRLAELRCKELEQELGWKPKVPSVALAYLKRIYPLPGT